MATPCVHFDYATAEGQRTFKLLWQSQSLSLRPKKGLSQKLFRKRLAQPFAMKKERKLSNKKKKPRTEAKRVRQKEDRKNPCF